MGMGWFISFALFSGIQTYHVNPDSILALHYTKTLEDTVFEVGEVVRLPEIGFSIPAYHAIQNGDSLYYPLRDFLLRNPFLIGQLQVHTDTRGSADANLRLSLLRANQLVDYFLEKFASDTLFSERIIPVGKGESSPLIPEAICNSYKTDKATYEMLQQLNRRLEFKVTGFLGKNYYRNQRAALGHTDSDRDPVSYDELVMIADRALLAGDYEKALRYYSAAAEIAPVNETFAKEQRNKLLALKGQN